MTHRTAAQASPSPPTDPTAATSNRKAILIGSASGVVASVLSAVILSLAKVIGRLSFAEIVLYVVLPGLAIMFVVATVIGVRAFNVREAANDRLREAEVVWRA